MFTYKLVSSPVNVSWLPAEDLRLTSQRRRTITPGTANCVNVTVFTPVSFAPSSMGEKCYGPDGFCVCSAFALQTGFIYWAWRTHHFYSKQWANFFGDTHYLSSLGYRMRKQPWEMARVKGKSGPWTLGPLSETSRGRVRGPKKTLPPNNQFFLHRLDLCWIFT